MTNPSFIKLNVPCSRHNILVTAYVYEPHFRETVYHIHTFLKTQSPTLTPVFFCAIFSGDSMMIINNQGQPIFFSQLEYPVEVENSEAFYIVLTSTHVLILDQETLKELGDHNDALTR